MYLPATVLKVSFQQYFFPLFLNDAHVSSSYHLAEAGLYLKRRKPMKEWKITKFQIQPFADVLQNSSFKFCKTHKKNYVEQSVFVNKVAGLTPSTLLKKRCRHSCFLVNFVKVYSTSF